MQDNSLLSVGGVEVQNVDLGVEIPRGFIVIISGVPGVGKTTISYELLKRFDCFRIIEETDLIREILRGYNKYIEELFGEKARFVLDNIEIYEHTKLLDFSEMVEQSKIMTPSIKHIIARQKRKGISSIINGVHIVPSLMEELSDYSNMVYVNLHVNSEEALKNRILERDPNSYMLDEIKFMYERNLELSNNVEKFIVSGSKLHQNIDSTNLTIQEVIGLIMANITKMIKG